MASTMALHELLDSQRDAIMQRWKALVHGKLAPESTPTIELMDQMPQFLEEIIAALRKNEGLTSQPPRILTTAVEHGQQRLRLGFSLDAVVREYGALRTAIVATAIGAGAQVSFREFQVIFDAVIEGIAHAVAEYARQRDAELVRQANEHFAFIAHELRNSLGSASMAFQLLRATGKLPAETHAVGALERGLQQTRELIDESLHVARFASGIELRWETVELRAFIEDIVVAARHEAEAKGVEIRILVDHRMVIFDRRLVRSAIDNLIRNAIKYSRQGGDVELRGRVDSERVVIEIEDCCGGLPPGRVEAAFAPFVRLDSKQDGFGLGLAIAKQAVDAHGGSIRIQNLPGKGCVFVLDLPVVEADPPPSGNGGGPSDAPELSRREGLGRTPSDRPEVPGQNLDPSRRQAKPTA